MLTSLQDIWRSILNMCYISFAFVYLDHAGFIHASSEKGDYI